MKLVFAALLLLSAVLSPAQEPSLGDVARASRAQQAKSVGTPKVFSNEDAGPQEIKDSDDPLEVYMRAVYGLMHDTSHRCQTESSGNSGPGWKKKMSFEIGGPDRTRIVSEDGPDRMEWIIVGADYYIKSSATAWQKLSTTQATALGKAPTPGTFVPQELQFRFEQGELKFLANDVVAGLPVVLYRYLTHSADFDRTVSYWIGKADSLPRRVEMRTVTRSWGSAPVTWQESVSCTYGVAIKVDPPM